MPHAHSKFIAEDSVDLISVDVFDTLLLRDHTVQRWRFLEVAKELAKRLPETVRPADIKTIVACRRLVHDLAYRAVALDRPQGDARLIRMAEIQASLLGFDRSTVALFLAAERDVELRHLVGNHPLCQTLRQLRRRGKRIIALSDTYMSVADLRILIDTLIPDSPIQHIYSSSDLNLTKHSGQVFEEVATLERVPPSRIVHFGDNIHSDFNMARAAGWQAVLSRRSAWIRYSRMLFAMFALLQPEFG